jgi:hypothetical protein
LLPPTYMGDTAFLSEGASPAELLARLAEAVVLLSRAARALGFEVNFEAGNTEAFFAVHGLGTGEAKVLLAGRCGRSASASSTNRRRWASAAGDPVQASGGVAAAQRGARSRDGTPCCCRAGCLRSSGSQVSCQDRASSSGTGDHRM